MSNIDKFLSRYKEDKQTAAFEYYVSTKLSETFRMHHYEKACDPGNGERVVWYGKSSPFSKSSDGDPDIICECKGFFLLGEVSLGDQNNQWRKELTIVEKHFDEFINRGNVKAENLLTAFFCRNINDYSLSNIGPVLNKTHMALLTVNMLLKVREISNIVPFVSHIEIWYLLKDLNELLRSTNEPKEYISKATKRIDDWGKTILESQKYILYGIESYRILSDQKEPYLDATKIYENLVKKKKIKKLLRIANAKINSDDIIKSIIEHRFGTYVGRAMQARLYSPMPSADLNATYRRILEDALE
jgi:hypothetical protein